MILYSVWRTGLRTFMSSRHTGLVLQLCYPKNRQKKQEARNTMVCQILLLLSTWCEDHASWKEIIWPTKKLDEGEIKGDIFWSMRPEDKEKEKRRSNVCPAISTASSFKQMADGSRGPSPALAVYYRPRNPSLPVATLFLAMHQPGYVHGGAVLVGGSWGARYS